MQLCVVNLNQGVEKIRLCGIKQTMEIDVDFVCFTYTQIFYFLP